MQQYFPRVRYETINRQTSLILDGTSKSAFFVVAERQKKDKEVISVKGYVLSREGRKMSGFFHMSCGFG